MVFDQESKSTMTWNEATQVKCRRTDDHRQNNLNDEEWQSIEPMTPKPGGMGRPRKIDLRQVFGAIRYMLAPGCRWRLLPGSFSTIQNYFYAWSRSSVIRTI